MQRTVDLPTGPQPEWEIQEHDPPTDDLQLRSVAESLVLLQSLRQSRNKWVTSMFPKFSTKTRVKTAEITPPPHTIKAHGKYDLCIGPHIFSGTAVYEVHYLPSVDQHSGPEAQSAQPTPSPSYFTAPTYPQPSQSSPSSSSSSYVTPALSSRVATAAQTDPILANLLSAVISRTATAEQVKRLGVLVRQLEGIPELGPLNGPPAPSPSAAPPFRPVSPKPFDIILEFHEKPSDKWILPRGDVFCERVGVAEGTWTRYADVITTTTMTPSCPPADPSGEQAPETHTPEVVKASVPQSYLQHRLPEGDLLTEVQNAVAPPYAMKSIKPLGADSNRTKRKSVSRKPTLIVSETPFPAPVKPAPVKRRQSLKAKPSLPPTPIACHACGQTDVPLMMGGNTGKAVADVPQIPQIRESAAAPRPQKFLFVPMEPPRPSAPAVVPRSESSAPPLPPSPLPFNYPIMLQQATPPSNPGASG
ncbi:hypothetical protein GSI_06502 [Ganoderma sinense ZZ0214-1]|uniref:Uncharacterized protein n=1 Tax=Ganoderma sinense ZZ0214-1 TaxID=1077348 RepID=A0A2G8SDZ2_9APHY|nr:hypothetical protein GSI_06502 [Ganoderma sinense ZZ0214-1]